MFRIPTSRMLVAAGLTLALPLCARAIESPANRGTEPANAHQSVSLQPADVDALRRKVLVQCGLDGSTARNVLPWYFHFAYGQALLDAGDARRAVVQLSQAIELKPVPRAHKRTYGMWYTDYLPYFQLAEAHAKLDNWPCAEHALQMSQSTGETGLGRIEAQRIRELQEGIDRHATDIGSCDLRDVRDADDAEGRVGG